jgi:hypothetical protein
VETRRGCDYFANLFGPNPIPVFRSWNDAKLFVRKTIVDKEYIQKLQSDIARWWTTYKLAVRQQALEIVTKKSNQVLIAYASTKRNQLALLYEPLRLIEVLRHQNRFSLARRFARPFGPFERMVGDMLGSRDTRR